MITFFEIAGMLLLTASLYLLMIYIYNNRLTSADQRIAIDYLPFPVYFGLSNNFPLVVNDKMYELIYNLKGSPLTDMSKDIKYLYDNRLKMTDVEEELLKKFDGSFFISYQGRIYCIEEKLFAELDNKILQINGQDVTEEYNNLCSLQKLNVMLREQNERLQQYIRDSIEINHQKELLDAKINIHGKFGDCLAMTRHLLNTPQDLELKKKVCGLWKEIIVGFTTGTDNKSQNFKEYDELLRISKLVGCKLIIEGSLPTGEGSKLLVKFLREALNNAIRHANASCLTVKMPDFKETGIIAVTDDGHSDKPFTKMGGGLSSLKDMLEKNGILMTINTASGFEITLQFPRALRD